MSPKEPKQRIWPIVLAVVLLALVCVAAVELVVCRFADPVLYEQITAPVRAGVQQLAETGEAAWNGAVQLGHDLSGKLEDIGNHLSELAEQLSGPKDGETDPELTQLADTVEMAPPRDLLDPAISSLEERDGLEYLTGGGMEIVYYNQTDEVWADQPYGTDRLGGYGCGPAAMAMAVSSLTGTPVDPAEMAALCVDRGYWCRRHGSYYTIVGGVAEAYGLTCTPMPPEDLSEEELITYLATGGLAVALMTKGHFTNGGHFILLRGVTLDGSILVADPASRERSLTSWDLSLILEELSQTRANGAPLWLLSPSQ